MPTGPTEIELQLGPDEAFDEAALRRAVGRALGADPEELPEIRLLRRSIDARRGRVRLHLRVGIGIRPSPQTGSPPREVSRGRPVVVVGGGPAGLFCAYELARAGVGACVVDRGKRVQPRRHDLKALNRHGVVDEDSNYCFGEGGAGTFSDGKLYTRSTKRGDVGDVIDILAGAGAPESIRIDARPHIGSNRLPKVVTELRERLERVGVEFRFETRITDLRVRDRRVLGVRCASGEDIDAEAVVLATGHSARDVFELQARHVSLEAKPFALGVRVEHPQPLINRIQYGQHASHPRLPSAYYRAATTVEERGVYSFCMCPGGFVVPAATETESIVVNGMSLSKRNSPFANSGVVVAVELEDLARTGLRGPLAGVALQRAVEEAAYRVGGAEGLRAPATRVVDFLEGRASTTLPDGSYLPGLEAANVADALDPVGLGLSERLRTGLRQFERSMRGFVTDDAVVIATESRTSSPVRVPRDPETLESEVAGLYPCGEGAGYAGGIVSAALDGMRVARAVCRSLRVAQYS